MPTFKEWVTQTLAPVWLRGVWGTRFLGVLGEAMDRMVGLTKEGIKAAHPPTCPIDALGYNGAARNIERYTYDTHASYRARIADPWSLWNFAGSKAAIVSRVHEQGYLNVTVYSWRELSPYYPEPWASLSWSSAFWVLIDPPHRVLTDGSWDSPGTWDDTVPATLVGGVPGPGTWDSNMTLPEVNELRASIRKWKEGHEICTQISIITTGVYSDHSFLGMHNYAVTLPG